MFTLSDFLDPRGFEALCGSRRSGAMRVQAEVNSENPQPPPQQPPPADPIPPPIQG